MQRLKTGGYSSRRGRKEKRIREAEGQAEAILKVQQANADGIRAIKEAGADVLFFTLKEPRGTRCSGKWKGNKDCCSVRSAGLASLATTFKGIVEE